MENILNIPRPQSISKENFDLGKNLYMKLYKKQITPDEFYKEVTYFALLYGFDELIPHLEPTRPEEMLQYDSLTFAERKKINEDEKFWKQPAVYSYLKEKTRIQFLNKSNKEWLELLLRRLEFFGDTVHTKKVRMRLNEFR